MFQTVPTAGYESLFGSARSPQFYPRNTDSPVATFNAAPAANAYLLAVAGVLKGGGDVFGGDHVSDGRQRRPELVLPSAGGEAEHGQARQHAIQVVAAENVERIRGVVVDRSVRCPRL